MKIAGKCFVDVTTELARVPNEIQEIKVEDGILYAKVWEGQRSFWASVGSLKDEREAWEKMFEILAWRLSTSADKAGLTKAEVRRRLVKIGAISK